MRSQALKQTQRQIRQKKAIFIRLKTNLELLKVIAILVIITT
jgi:hypothetical protein